jgi:hypothetical protein
MFKKKRVMNKSFFAKQVEEYGGPVFQPRRCQKKKKVLFYQFASEERGVSFSFRSLSV